MKVFYVEDLKDDIRIDPYTYNPRDPIGVFNLKAYIPKAMREIMSENDNHIDPIMKVVFSDGEEKDYYFKDVVFHIIIWRIFIALKLPVLSKHYFYFENMLESTMSSIHTDIYPELLQTGVDERKIFGLFHESISILHNFSHVYTWAYATGLSLYKLYNLYAEPDIREICEINLPNPLDTKAVETIIEVKKKELIKRIVKYHANTCIGQYLRTKTLNENQIAQMFIGYGPRSDVNDNILGKPILSSTLSGLQSIEEFAVESLSAKKSAILNRTSVGTASYNNRQGHLTTCEIYNIVPGDCGNTETLRIFIPVGKTKRFYGKWFIINGEAVIGNPQTLKPYEGCWIDMVSALHCRCTSGLCKRCIGQMSDYISSLLHLGMATGSEVFSEIVQKILSSKHLIKTNTIEYDLNADLSKYFMRSHNKFLMKQLPEGYKIAFPQSSVGGFNTLESLDYVKENEFSTITVLLILNEKNEIVETLHMTQDPIRPYFSANFILYLINKKKDIVLTEEDLWVVPMDKWRWTTQFFKHDITTYDMNSYVSSVWAFLNNDLKRFKNASEAVHNFCDVIYNKTEVNIFLVEIILRSLMIAGPDDFNFPIRNPGDPIFFGSLKHVIANRAFTPKLAFEGLYSSTNSKAFFNQPSNYLKPVSIGIFAEFFNY